MAGKKARQLNLIGILFLVLTAISLLSLVLMISVANQIYEDADQELSVPASDGATYESKIQTNSVMKSMLVGMLICSIVLPLICLITGISILRRKSHRSCIIGAVVVALMAFPLGTILCVWSLMLLCDAESRQLFGEQQDG
ncbi:hypothetical protein [uncultured Gimesia sp.]|uniref:hypothetical protein n=1 Tax=uncultured Gimesia sp. TaxID=1678688 RepID=UPI0030D93472|tara:strand:- start:7956 stop:8378 length:423 start_codon:yes stop_codon:yes gene_type:complete